MKRSQGFTVIELIVVIVFVATASTLLFIQRSNLTATYRDDQRKIAINAMYYNLEEVFYATNGYYPTTIDSKALPAMDPELFKDPAGTAVGDQDSDYRYEATNCTDNKCKSYTLRADLEKEDDYVKANKDRS
jgi:type II secretory pathway pseudopilin PulG